MSEKYICNYVEESALIKSCLLDRQDEQLSFFSAKLLALLMGVGSCQRRVGINVDRLSVLQSSGKNL
tara:strand:- start:452 stop:652 length:201 start_codon:yes stop_codon:yes gene_type:complete